MTDGVSAATTAPDTNKAKESHGSQCLNCDTPLVGAYCHQCGQQGHLHRTLSAIWHDLAHGVLHFEGQIWHTLPLLLAKPGELTRRYIHGQRARFISPFALFLFAVFMMFAVIQVRGIHLETPEGFKEGQQQAGSEIAADRGKLEQKLADIDARFAKAKSNGADSADLLKERAKVQGEMDDLSRITINNDGEMLQVNTGIPTLNKAIAKANKNPDLVLYKMQNSAYKFSWLLIPISVPFLWLLFAWRREYKVYDHAIFVIYSLGFFTLLAALFTVLQSFGVPGWLLMRVFLIIAPIHMFLQMKQAYQLSWGNALLRTGLLLIFAMIVIIIFLLILIMLGVAG